MMTVEECNNALTKLQDTVSEHLRHDASMYHEKEDNEMNESLAMMIGQNSMRNGYGYGDGTWNNPFMYLIFLALFGRNGFGINGECMGAGQAMQSLGEIKSALAAGGNEQTRLANQIANVGTQMGFSKDFLYSAVMNNSEKICGAVNTLQAQLANGNHNILQQLCCLGSNIQQGLSGLAIGQERQTNALQQSMTQLGFINERNASDLRALVSREACETRQSAHADRDAILGWLTNDKIQSLQEKLTAAALEISQRNQTDAIKQAIYDARNTGAGYVNALNPNGSQSYPYWVNNTVQA